MSARVRFEAEGAIGVLTFETPGRTVNTFDSGTVAELEHMLDLVESRHGLRGLVLCSARQSTFLAGADLGELDRILSAEQVESWLRRAQRVLERLERLPFPTVAAIRGAALGGGLEVALACTFRIATDEATTVLGLPEVRLGLIPAAGGTWRLPRQVGFRRGLELLLSGRRVGAAEALAIGLVDEVVAAPALAAACRRVLAERPPATRVSRLLDRVIASSWPGRQLAVALARRAVLRRSGRRFPAPFAILAAARVGGRGAEQVERRAFARLALSAQSRALVGLFFATRAARPKGELRPATALPRIGVVGTGLMGGGIARSALRSGHLVRLFDADPAAIGRTLAETARAVEQRRLRRRGRACEVRSTLARLQPAADIAECAGCVIVIEAVAEDLAAKREVLAQVAAVVSPTALIASNTSTLPIAALAEGLPHPERIIGLHFFSPVEKMPLVEIVRPEAVSTSALSAARAFVAGLGKTAIVVRDGPGFFTTRLVGALAAHATALAADGHSIAAIDSAGRHAGFPVGPLTLLDEIGLDVAAHAARTLHAAFPSRFPAPDELAARVDEGRLGRKSGSGFYDYRGARRTVRRVGVLDGRASRVRSRDDLDQMAEQLLLATVGEAIRCLDEGIIAAPVDGDLGAVLGLGFPAETGGPFLWADRLGAGAVVERLAAVEAVAGALFAPPPMLIEAARLGLGFYDLTAFPAGGR